ncbi:DUF3152 domain-containing protein [Actinokineospora inagensis]|uniref:DUF3152 domain-containing protein n=1 Tax=Actinokineospora inagensis TaxID=103730 RepID=UPI0004267868|nr:DUF3152 domain-containing protein [Actinokineospora inagensis]
MTQGEPNTATRSSRSASDRAGESGDGPSRRGRRATAEPLAASWSPERRGSTGGKQGKRGFVATYGWRLYAVPLLIAVTVLVAVQTAKDRSTPADASGATNTAGTVNPVADGSNGPPDVTERPSAPVDLNIPTAELPNGGPYTQAGTGQWHVVPGSGQKVGTGPKLYTYTVDVEDGIDPTVIGGDDTFARLVEQTLDDPRGWTGLGEISVQRVGADFPNPSFRISLTTPNTIHREDLCGYSIKYESSCYRSSAHRVMINLARWSRGAVAFDGDMLSYRQYAINHEVGHAFRNGHVGCPQAGALAPVMMQQSFGVANNYVAQLNKAAGNPDPVKADGLVCKPNAWPNPQARPAG